MKKTPITAALVAAAVATAVAVLPASGQSPAGTRTLTFTSVEKSRDQGAIDVKPKGPSVGDRFFLSSGLSQSGKAAGRVEGDCVALDKTYHALMCTAVVILADGRMTIQGAATDKPLPGVGKTAEEYIVTGGSGAYQGATGVMTRRGNGTRDTLTFTLAS